MPISLGRGFFSNLLRRCAGTLIGNQQQFRHEQRAYKHNTTIEWIGYGFSNMALGVYSSYTQASQYATGRYRYTNAESYVQDTWKLTRRLTLDFGLRFQWIQPQFDADEQTSTFLPEKFTPGQAPRIYRPTGTPSNRQAINPGTGQILNSTYIGKIVNGTGNLLNGIQQAGKDISKYLIRNRGIHYVPRFGFAFDVTGKQNIVVRGGGGMFYDRFQGNEVFDMLTNPPTTFAPTLVNDLLGNLNPNNIQVAPGNLHAFRLQRQRSDRV